MRDNLKRRQERARRKQLFERLRLQSEILCDSYKEGDQTVIINRMMLIILDIVGTRGMNDAKREALADHFSDSAIGSKRDVTVELGGSGDRDTLYLDGAFRVSDLAKRLTWAETRTQQTLEEDSV